MVRIESLVNPDKGCTLEILVLAALILVISIKPFRGSRLETDVLAQSKIRSRLNLETGSREVIAILPLMSRLSRVIRWWSCSVLGELSSFLYKLNTFFQSF